VPIATVINCLITFSVQFLLFLVIYLVLMLKGVPLHPSYRVIVLPALMLQMAMLGIGIGCLVSSITVRYRDVAMVMGFAVQMWMYASCVFYPLSSIPKEWQWLMVLNPMVPVIESFRFAFLGSGTVEIWQLGIGAVMSVLILFAGVVLFNHTARTFNDSI
jgi:lipopolysaccharide transport system permease protein